MAYVFLTEVKFENGFYRKYWCASTADLSSLPTSPTIAKGSEAVLESGAVYRLSNANTWLIYSPATSSGVTITGMALANYTAMTLAASGIIKATAGTLHSIAITNGSASEQYIQLHDSATLPANTAVPIFSLLLQARGIGFFDWPVYGKSFAAGIVWCNSSTLATKTIGSADCTVTATYK